MMETMNDEPQQQGASNTAATTTTSANAATSSSRHHYFAQVTFRVRAEKLGFGEDLFLIPIVAASASSSAASSLGGHQHHHRVSELTQFVTNDPLFHYYYYFGWVLIGPRTLNQLSICTSCFSHIIALPPIFDLSIDSTIHHCQILSMVYYPLPPFHFSSGTK